MRERREPTQGLTAQLGGDGWVPSCSLEAPDEDLALRSHFARLLSPEWKEGSTAPSLPKQDDAKDHEGFFETKALKGCWEVLVA